MDLGLTVNSISSGLSSSTNFKYALTTSSTSCTDGVIGSGTFNGTTAGDYVSILTKSYSASTTETYYLYIWLDSAETSSSTQNQTFSMSLSGSCDNLQSQPNAPVLDDGLIPIVFDTSDGTTIKTISSSDSSWYDYANQEWANAILVSDSSRSTYQNTTGVTVDEDDILAYFVWIPRYSYKIWTTSTSSSGNEQEIEIIFESSSTKSTGTAVGEYLTYPAFTIGSNELDGIWVGKFETSGTADNPTVIPNVSSLRSQTVSAEFQTALKFAGGTLSDGTVSFSGSSTYGISSSTNSHMMKNSEWGAVAYLSHSKYGVNREVYINNSSGYYIGRSGGDVGGSTAINTVYTSETSTTQYSTYGFYTWDGYLLDYGTNTATSTRDLTKVASIIGNITGVYDMSGGAWEYVMGVLADDDGNPRSGYSTSYNSGFNGVIYDSGSNTSYTSGIAFPSSEYYDLYTSTSSTSSAISLSLTGCSGTMCYGHALSETANWYSDFASFVTSEYPWFIRGGNYGNGANAGAFNSDNDNGSANSNRAARVVLVCGTTIIIWKNKNLYIG